MENIFTELLKILLFKVETQIIDQPQKKDGAYHLDGDYTAFGKVINGMSVVDKIANLKTDKREWPIENVRFKTVIIK